MIKNALLVAVLLLGSSGAGAEEPKAKPSSLMTWFQNLKNGLRESSVSGRMQKGRRASSVAAVRGSAQGDDRASLDEGTMKQPSMSKKAKRERKEKAAFESAIDLIVAGKTAEGLSALDAFEKNYPKSDLLPQVAEARAKAQELQAAAAPQEEATQPKGE
jgi:TolA-binding protein